LKQFWRKKQFWGGLVAIALLAYCLWDIKISELEDLWQRINGLYLIPAVFFSFMYVIIRALRWRLLVSQQKQITIVRATTLFSAGQVLNIAMPALTGQLGRIFLFARKEGLKKSFIFSTIVLEVLFDAISLIVLIVLTSLIWPFPETQRFYGFIITAVTIVAVIGLYLLLHFQESIQNFARRRFRNRSPGAYITIKKFLRSFTSGIELLRRSQHVIGSMLYSLVSWITHLLAIYYLLKSFGLELSLWAAAVIMIFNTIVLMVPITPGNAGTFEFVVSGSLAAFAVGRSDAVLFALALHLLDFLPMFTMAASFIHLERKELRDIREAHKEEVLFDRITEEGAFAEEGPV